MKNSHATFRAGSLPTLTEHSVESGLFHKMQIKKTISDDQRGTDRAALDLAIKLDFHHGGWISKGRFMENSPLPSNQLKEMPTSKLPRRKFDRY
jgi:hypothetical protein